MLKVSTVGVLGKGVRWFLASFLSRVTAYAKVRRQDRALPIQRLKEVRLKCRVVVQWFKLSWKSRQNHILS